MTTQHRIQAPELQGNVPLRPAPIQSDTFAMPARPVGSESLGRLADALGSFSNSIGNVLPVMASTAQQQQDQAWAEQRKFSGWTRDDYVKAVEEGRVPNYGNEFTQKAIQASFGLEYGSHRADQLRQDLLTNFDWDHGDVDAYLAKAVRADVEQYGQDRNFGANYLRQMDGLRSWALGQAEKRKAEGFVETQHRAAFGFIDTMVDHGIKAGSDPEAIAGSIYAEYANLGKDGALGVDYKALDQEVLNKARRIASTNPEVALALIHRERPDNSGGMRSLASNPDMQDAVIQIHQTALRAASARAEDKLQAELIDADYQFLRHGNLDQVADYRYRTLAGEERTVSADQRKEAASTEYLRKSAEIAKGNRETQAETLSRELRAYRLSGMKHPGLAKAVSGIADMASVDMEQDPEARKKLLGKLKAYQWLEHESTNSPLAYTDEKDRSFAETFFTAQRYLGQDPDAALGTAIRATQVTKEGMETLARYWREIDAEVNDLATKPGRLWNSGVEPANSSIARQRVANLAGTFVRLGLKPAEAVKQAAAAVKKTSVTYNDVLLNLQGLDVPENFAESVDAAVADFAAKSPRMIERNGVDVSDIAIAPASSGDASGGRS